MQKAIFQIQYMKEHDIIRWERVSALTAKKEKSAQLAPYPIYRLSFLEPPRHQRWQAYNGKVLVRSANPPT